jgi:hypothetical protein
LAKKKQIKIVRGRSDSNYTFLDTMSDPSKEYEGSNVIKDRPNVDKGILKKRSIDSKKRKVRHKSRIMGGLIQQSHSSVYE